MPDTHILDHIFIFLFGFAFYSIYETEVTMLMLHETNYIDYIIKFELDFVPSYEKKNIFGRIETGEVLLWIGSCSEKYNGKQEKNRERERKKTNRDYKKI